MEHQQIKDRIQSLKQEITLLEEQIKIPDWDNVHTNFDLVEVREHYPDWNSWTKCPVGSLLKDDERIGDAPRDMLLSMLGNITANAIEGRTWAIIMYVRDITRMRLKELRGE